MSPEQARGKTVDRSADVWAFACVLYEMLTGQKAFDGETVTDILGAIVKSEPDWNALPPTVPPYVRRLLKRCLQKDRRHRLRDAGAVALELEEPGDELIVGSQPASVFNRAVWFLAGALIFSAIVAVAAIQLRSVPEPTEIRVEINTPPTTDEISLAVSPDGQKLVFVGVVDNQPKLLLRSLESLAVQPLAGTEGASYPFWSPDSRSIAFFADGQLKRVELSRDRPALSQAHLLVAGVLGIATA
jgi:serine/threonine protein kinase